MPVKNLLRKVSHILPDPLYLRLKYLQRMHRVLHLKHPQTYTEKLQWLKLHDRNPQYAELVDKCDVKKYVSEQIGEESIIPTLGVWERFGDIPFDQLPERFVLKCTHDSGGTVICKDKAKLDRQTAQRKIERCLNRNYYWHGREWPYKDLKPRIIAEPYMADPSGNGLRDYKLWCFHGEPKMTLVCTGRFSEQGLREDFYDMNWNRLPVQRPNHPGCDERIERPKQYELMQRLAKKLSKGIPFVRIDFYEINGRVYFGEFTFFPASGMTGFVPAQWDKKLGEMLRIPK